MNFVTLPPRFQMARYLADLEADPDSINLSASDLEAWNCSDLVELADPECKALWDGMKLVFSDTKGFPPLLAEISKLHKVDSNDVLTIAPQEGIYIAMTCLVAYLQQKHGLEKFHVVATYPGYQGLYENLKSIHHVSCDFEAWKLSYTKEGWRFNLNELKNLIRGDTKLLVVNFPHNPTGYVPDAEEWQQIVDLCKEKGIFLFSDEMYSCTNNDGSDPLPTACSMTEDAITLFGLSKGYALSGLRIGWLCSKNKEIIKMAQGLKDYISQCSAVPSEILALIALRNSDKVLNRSMTIIKKNLALWNSFIAKHPDIFDWHPPRAGTTGFLKLKGWLLNDVGGGSATGVCKHLVEQAKIVLVPSALFSYDDQFVRISFARDITDKGLELFEEFLQKNQPK